MFRRKMQSGFTLVELSLAMAFISMLLLAIALLVMQIASIYNKGLTLRAVDQAGQRVISDIERTLGQSQPVQVVPLLDKASGGRLCVVNTVYAWTYGGFIKDGDLGVLNKYVDSSPVERPVYLAKFRAEGGKQYCAVNGAGVYEDIPSTAQELLSGEDMQLAVHNFTVSDTKVTGDDKQHMYRVTIRLGTSEQGILDAAQGGCEAPTGRIDDEYCAVNEFEIIARSGNKETGNE